MKKKQLIIIVFLSLVQLSFGDSLIKLAVTIPVETTLSDCSVESASDVWLSMIKTAKKSIDFGEFYITNKSGKRLEKIVEELQKAGARGVKIRFITDKKMLKNSQSSIEGLKKIKGIEFAVFDWKKLTGGVLHAKYFIIDEKICYIGSQNFDWRSLTHIHETGIRIDEIELVKSLQAIFNADWNYAKGDLTSYLALNKKKFICLDNLYLTGSPEEYLPKGVKFSLKTLINLIDGAKNKITIQLLNFSTNIHKSKKKFILINDALKKAAKKGVRINILVSDWNKKKPAVDDLIALSEIYGIELKFITIPIAKDGFIPYSRVIHSKVMRIDDDICWIGTSNWSKDYFTKSRNFEVVLKNKKVALQLDCLFNSIWNSSYGLKIKSGTFCIPPKIN